jgi:hypothetical protein
MFGKMRTPGRITFMCLITFFVVSMDPEDPVKWHTTLTAFAALCCGIMAAITELQNVRGRKHLISGRAGSVTDVA